MRCARLQWYASSRSLARRPEQSEPTRTQIPEISWRQIVGTRDRLIHGYEEVDLDILWTIVTDDLPVLVSELNAPSECWRRLVQLDANDLAYALQVHILREQRGPCRHADNHPARSKAGHTAAVLDARSGVEVHGSIEAQQREARQ
jgi:hypothetical protein